MANIFLRSTDGLDANAGTQKEAPKATLAAALTAAGAGGNVFVSSLHAETQASAMTLTPPGTAANPNRVLCVPDWGAATGTGVPASVSTGATVSTTGANSIVTAGGYAYTYGIAFQAGSAASAANFSFGTSAKGIIYDNCTIKLNNTSGSSLMVLGGQAAAIDQLIELRNTTLNFGAAGQSVRPRGPIIWDNVTLAGTAPTVLVTAETTVPWSLLATGCDLSLVTGTLFTVSAALRQVIHLRNCKLGAGVTLTTGAIAGPGCLDLTLVNCDSGDTNYRYHKQNYSGTITHETTIVRTGGATDGTTPISRKLVTSADAKPEIPLTFDVIFWNETLGALSLASEIINDGATLTDADVWMEVAALTNSGSTKASRTVDQAASLLATPANQTSSSVAWTTTGLASPVKQKLEVSVTPAEKGWIRCRICLAKASSTVYVCPDITGKGFNTGRGWQTADAYMLEGASGGASGKPAFGPGEMFKGRAA